MNKIEEFTSILEKLEELDKDKFNSSEFQIVNNKLQELLVEISLIRKNYSQIIFLDNKNIFRNNL